MNESGGTAIEDELSGGSESDQGPAVEYELDLGPDPGSDPVGDPPGEQPPAPSDPPPAAADLALTDRLARIERENQELRQMASNVWAKRPETPTQARKRLADLQANPDGATVADLNEALRSELDDIRREAWTSSEQAALRANSAQRARGELSAQAMGEGYDYDSMRSRYLEPLYRQNPAVEQLLHSAVPNDSAMGEYVLALVLEVAQRSGGNFAQTFKQIRHSLAAPAAAGKELVQKIEKAAQRGADRTLRTSAPGTGPGKRRVTGKDIEHMSDEEFDQLERSVTQQMH